MEWKWNGIALLLFSILLALCFAMMGWKNFDLLFLEIPWPVVFLLTGAVGLALTFWPQRPGE